MIKSQPTPHTHTKPTRRSPFGPRSAALALMAAAFLLAAAVFWPRQSRPDAPSYPPEAVAYGDVLLVGQPDSQPRAAATAQVASTETGTGSPVAETPESYYDFGVIAGDAVVVRTFALRNQGDAPLVIQRAYTTCGCTTAEISAQVIPPGKLALVQMRFDAGFHDVRGMTVRRGLVVETNDALHPRVEMWVQATVR